MNNTPAHSWDDFTALAAAVVLLTAGLGAYLAPTGTAWPAAVGGPASATERFIGTRDIQEGQTLAVAAAPADPDARRPGSALPRETIIEEVAEVPSPVLIPKVAALPPAPAPGAAGICRAAVALAKNRRLGELLVRPDKGGIHLVSYVPWPDAPPDARVFRCKVEGQSVLWAPSAGPKNGWSRERLDFALHPAARQMVVRVTFVVSGKSQRRIHSFHELNQVCNGCEGFKSSQRPAENLVAGKRTAS